MPNDPDLHWHLQGKRGIEKRDEVGGLGREGRWNEIRRKYTLSTKEDEGCARVR